jgi:hypothetical protein
VAAGWDRPQTALADPPLTSTAVSCSTARTSAGVSRGQACFTSAHAPAIWGAAADVPLMAAQPSLPVVSSPAGCVPPARPTSIAQPGGSGSMMYAARGRIPTRPDTSGQLRPG